MINEAVNSKIVEGYPTFLHYLSENVAKWLRHLTRKPKVTTAVGSNPTLDSLVTVRNTSPGRLEPCEGNLVAVAGSCGRLMAKHPWPLLEISLSDFHRLATLNINTYLPTFQSFVMTKMNSVWYQYHMYGPVSGLT